jgi:hypothetical protein
LANNRLSHFIVMVAELLNFGEKLFAIENAAKESSPEK